VNRRVYHEVSRTSSRKRSGPALLSSQGRDAVEQAFAAPDGPGECLHWLPLPTGG